MYIENLNLGLGGDSQEEFEIEFDDEGNVLQVEKSSEKEDDEETKKPVPKGKSSEEEDEIDEDEESDDSSEDNEDKNKDIEENPFLVFANYLKEKEFLPDITEEELKNIKSDDDLAELMNKQMDNIVLSQLQEANEKSNGAVAHFLNGGTEEDFVNKFNKNENLNSLLNYNEDEIKEDEDIQRKVLKAYYKKTTNFNDKKISKLIDNDIELGETDDIIANYNELKEINKKEKEDSIKRAKQKELEVQENNKRILKQYQDNTYQYEEFIPGRKLDKKSKEKVFDNIKPTMEKINKDLTKYAPILSYLDHYGLLEGDFSKVIKDVETKQTSKLADVIKNTKFSKKSDSKDNDDFKTIIKNSIKNSPLQ